ncbi:MAG TPA: glycerol-3-phosphate 1-O-acyltransferase PlsY [Candidatus Binatia bacterium]|nr:glycerol-3-phosphate 1-O-acyltransferase PlsY [Candidatus Binatia bacterium]
MQLSLLLVSAYLIGSIPSGYLIGYLSGIDVRKAGSGNVGATNVGRVVGRKQGILTFFGDCAKGWIPVFAALHLEVRPAAVALVGLAAFLGHLYPVFLRFKGGKGVATAFGVMLAIAPLASLCLIGIFAGVLYATRTVSLASMTTAAASPIVLWGFNVAPPLTAATAVLAAMIFLRHRSNLDRLLAGTEPRVGGSSFR